MILDRCFPLYQQTYRIRLGQNHMEAVENDFRRLVEITGIDIGNK